METIDSSTFDTVINNDLVLVDFYAEWCGPCRMLIPNLEELEKNTNIQIKKVNVDNSRDLAKKYGVMTIPTIILFSKGKELKRNVGFISYDELESFIREYIKE